MIDIVGCGPGSAEYLTDAARAVVRDAHVLIGAPRLLGLFPDSTAQRIEVTADVEAALDAIDRHRNDGPLALLVSGDPGVFSLARAVVKRFGLDACRTTPGVSAVQVAFARLGLGWADARIVSAHGAVPETSPEELKAQDKIAVFTGGSRSHEWITLLLKTLSESHDAWVCRDLTLPGEQVFRASPADAGKLSSAGRTVLVLVKKGLPE